MKLYIVNPMYTSLFMVIVLSAYVSSLSLYITGGKTYLNNEFEIIYGGSSKAITKIDGSDFMGVKRIRRLTPKEISKLKEIRNIEVVIEKKQEEEERQREQEEQRRERRQEEEEREMERKQEEEERQREQEEQRRERRQEKKEREMERKQEEEERQREREEQKRERRQEKKERDMERILDEEEKQREQEEQERERRQEEEEDRERERRQEEEKRERERKLVVRRGIKRPRRNIKKAQPKARASQYEIELVQSNTGQQIRRTLSNKQNTPPGRLTRRKNLYA